MKLLFADTTTKVTVPLLCSRGRATLVCWRKIMQITNRLKLKKLYITRQCSPSRDRLGKLRLNCSLPQGTAFEEPNLVLSLLCVLTYQYLCMRIGHKYYPCPPLVCGDSNIMLGMVIQRIIPLLKNYSTRKYPLIFKLICHLQRSAKRGA